MADAPSTDAPPTPHGAEERTDLYCHQCRKTFLALLDVSITGNHIVECPYCGHEHCRSIENGKVTGVRWDSRLNRVDVSPRSVWKSDVLKIQTTTVAAHIRDQFLRAAWINRSDTQ